MKSIDSTLLSVFLTLATIAVALFTLYYTIPQNKKQKILRYIFVTIGIIIIGFFLAISDKQLALQTLFISGIIILSIGIIAIVVSYINKREIGKLALLPQFKSHDLQIGLDHIDKNINADFYSKMVNPTLKDKKDAMAAVLRQISLTTAPSNIKNQVRMGIFEVRSNGKFRVLAVNQIDMHRIPEIERTFSWKPEIVSAAGKAVVERKPILQSSLSQENCQDINWFETSLNRYPGYETKSILCVPVFEEDLSQNMKSKCLAVISISSSLDNDLTDKHVNEVIQYSIRVRQLLNLLNSKIIFDSEINHNKIRAITISGEVGSGKSTLVAELNGILKSSGWSVLNMGEKFREFCNSENISFNDKKELDNKVHEKFDNYQKKLLKKEDFIIVDGRISGFLAKDFDDVLTVYCYLSQQKRIDRVINSETNSSLSKEEIMDNIKDRDNAVLNRFKEIYNVEDYRSKEYYKLNLQTDKSPIELAREVIFEMNRLNSL